MTINGLISMLDTEENFTIGLYGMDFVLNTREEKRKFFFALQKIISGHNDIINEMNSKLSKIRDAGGWNEVF